MALERERERDLKIGLPKRKLVFQSSISRDYVSFKEGKYTVDKSHKEMNFKSWIWGGEVQNLIVGLWPFAGRQQAVQIFPCCHKS